MEAVSKSETAAWLAVTLGRSGECAEHIIFARARVAGMDSQQIRTAARELSIERYQGARSVMWRLPAPIPAI
jgi:hypothetical protein